MQGPYIGFQIGAWQNLLFDPDEPFWLLLKTGSHTPCTL